MKKKLLIGSPILILLLTLFSLKANSLNSPMGACCYQAGAACITEYGICMDAYYDPISHICKGPEVLSELGNN